MRHATAFGSVTLPDDGRPEQSHPLVARTSVLPGFRTEGVIDAWGDGKAPFEAVTYSVPFWLIGASEAAFETTKGSLAGAVGSRDKLYMNTLAGTPTDPELYYLARFESLEARYRRGFMAASPFQATFRLIEPIMYQDLGTAIGGYISSGSAVTVGTAVFGEGSDWDTPLEFVEVDISASPTSFTIDANPGHFRTHRLIIRVESDGASGINQLRLENLTLGQEISSTFVAADANGVWQANCAIGRNRVRRSTDGGSTWSNDWPNSAVLATQAPIMELAPGDNSMRFSTPGGAPNCRLRLLWKPAYGL